ncbi:MAG: ABC transporter substrate-binding protein [Wolbachia endosymbiont of Fragariocoptes setiger]|nr:ABC transporter substrate-binding protein [Wolbachia endosymbiont of Fragariocoptes setiger]
MKAVKILTIIIFIIIIPNIYANSENYKTFLRKLKKQVDEVFVEKNRDSCHKRLQKIVQDNVDLKKISHFVIGKHWLLISENERKEFLQEYERYFIQLCTKILDVHISRGELTIISTKKINEKEHLVNTRLLYDESGDFINIDFRIIENDNSFLINDIIISGTSISIYQRSQFSEKIDIHGISHVTKELKCKNAS